MDRRVQKALNLTTDQSIHGRIVDLEGTPLAGIQVAIHLLRAADGEKQLEDWINESKEKSPPSKIEDYFENHRNAAGKYSPYPGPFPTKDGGLEHGSPGLPADVKTDQDGRFQLSGLGPNRLAVS